MIKTVADSPSDIQELYKSKLRRKAKQRKAIYYVRIIYQKQHKKPQSLMKSSQSHRSIQVRPQTGFNRNPLGNSGFNRSIVQQESNHFKKNYTVYDKERIFEDLLQHKDRINVLTEENYKMKTAFVNKERELKKYEKVIEEIQQSGNIKSLNTKFSTESFLYTSLKKQIKDLQDEVRFKNEEINQMKRDQKYTRYLEIEEEKKCFMEETIRMRETIINMQEDFQRQKFNHQKNDQLENQKQIDNNIMNTLKQNNLELEEQLNECKKQLRQNKEQFDKQNVKINTLNKDLNQLRNVIKESEKQLNFALGKPELFNTSQLQKSHSNAQEVNPPNRVPAGKQSQMGNKPQNIQKNNTTGKPNEIKYGNPQKNNTNNQKNEIKQGNTQKNNTNNQLNDNKPGNPNKNNTSNQQNENKQINSNQNVDQHITQNIIKDSIVQSSEDIQYISQLIKYGALSKNVSYQDLSKEIIPSSQTTTPKDLSSRLEKKPFNLIDTVQRLKMVLYLTDNQRNLNQQVESKLVKQKFIQAIPEYSEKEVLSPEVENEVQNILRSNQQELKNILEPLFNSKELIDSLQKIKVEMSKNGFDLVLLRCFEFSSGTLKNIPRNDLLSYCGLKQVTFDNGDEQRRNSLTKQLQLASDEKKKKEEEEKKKKQQEEDLRKKKQEEEEQKKKQQEEQLVKKQEEERIKKEKEEKEKDARLKQEENKQNKEIQQEKKEVQEKLDDKNAQRQKTPNKTQSTEAKSQPTQQSQDPEQEQKQNEQEKKKAQKQNQQQGTDNAVQSNQQQNIKQENMQTSQSKKTNQQQDDVQYNNDFESDGEISEDIHKSGKQKKLYKHPEDKQKQQKNNNQKYDDQPISDYDL